MRSRFALVRLLRAGLLVALMLGVVVRPALVQLAELHADQHRSLAAHAAGDTDPANGASADHDDRSTTVDRGEPQPHHDDRGLHALLHVSCTGGAVGHLTPGLAYTAMNIRGSHPWRALPMAAPTVRLPSPLRPPIA